MAPARAKKVYVKPGTGRLLWVGWCRIFAILFAITAFIQALGYLDQGTDGTGAGLIAVAFAVLSTSPPLINKAHP